MLLKPLRKAVHPCLGGAKGRFLIIAIAFIGSAVIGTGALLLLRQPQAYQKDFGNYSWGLFTCQDECSKFMGKEDPLTWGPDVGWWMAIVAFAISILVLILVAYKRTKFGYQKI